MVDRRDARELSDDWASLCIDFSRSVPSAACLGSQQAAMRHDADAMGRLVSALLHFAGTSLLDLEMCIELPPRQGLYQDDVGITVAFETDLDDHAGSGAARVYRITSAARVSALIAVGQSGSHLMAFECH